MTRLLADPAPKTELLSYRATERQKEAVDTLAQRRGVPRSHLLRHYPLRELLEMAEELEVEL